MLWLVGEHICLQSSSTRESNNSNECNTIQKDGVKRGVAAVGIGFLLHPTYGVEAISFPTNQKWRILYPIVYNNKFNIFQLNFKPNSVLLQDQMG